MTSKLKVNILADGGDNAIMTSNGSGTLTLNNAALKATPAFFATTSGASSVTHNVTTKVTFNTEVLDTNNNYDASTNYRFTPTTAGKYFCFVSLSVQKIGAVSNTKFLEVDLNFNGSLKYRSYMDYSNSDAYAANGTVNGVIDFNGSSDYIEAFMKLQTADGNNAQILGANYSMFGAYRIIGA